MYHHGQLPSSILEDGTPVHLGDGGRPAPGKWSGAPATSCSKSGVDIIINVEQTTVQIFVSYSRCDAVTRLQKRDV